MDTATLAPVADDLTVDVATAAITINGHTAPLRAFADAAYDGWVPQAFHAALDYLGYGVATDEEIEMTPGETAFTVVPLYDFTQEFIDRLRRIGPAAGDGEFHRVLADFARKVVETTR
jgi:hypothetical protein